MQGAAVLHGRRAADAAGAGPGGLGRRGHAAGAAPPARGAVLHRRRTGDAGRAAASPARSTTPTAYTLRGLLQAAGCEVQRPGHRARPAGRHARRAAPRRRRQRPDPDLRRRLGRRGRPSAPGGEGRGRARPVADRDEAGQAAGLRRSVRRRRCSSACRATRCRASSPSCWRWRRCCARCRAARRPPPAAARCAPTSTGRGPTGGASSCACGSMPRVGWTLFPNQSSGVLTSHGLGRWPGRQPGRPGDRARRQRALPAAGRPDAADEDPGALLRLAARGAGPGEAVEVRRRHARWARCATCSSRAAAAMPRCWRAAAPLRCALNQVMAATTAPLAPTAPRWPSSRR